MTRNYLGVRVLSLTEDLRAYFKAPRGRGILVSRVEEDTPAAKAGLRPRARLVAYRHAGGEPQLNGLGPLPRVRKGFAHARLKPVGSEVFE